MMVDIIESDEQQQQDQEQEEQKEEMWALERLQWPFMNSFFMYSLKFLRFICQRVLGQDTEQVAHDGDASNLHCQT